MAIVTETYIIEQNEGYPEFPSAARARLAAELSSGAILSFTKTLIVDGPHLVAGKTKHNIVRVFKSEEDRVRIANDNLADAVLTAYIISTGYQKSNIVLS